MNLVMTDRIFGAIVLTVSSSLWIWVFFLNGASKWSDAIEKFYSETGHRKNHNPYEKFKFWYSPKAIKIGSTLFLVIAVFIFINIFFKN